MDINVEEINARALHHTLMYEIYGKDYEYNMLYSYIRSGGDVC